MSSRRLLIITNQIPKIMKNKMQKLPLITILEMIDEGRKSPFKAEKEIREMFRRNKAVQFAIDAFVFLSAAAGVAFFILLLTGLLSVKANAQDLNRVTKWYVDFPAEVVVLSDSADAGHSVVWSGSGLFVFKVKADEVIYSTIVDATTRESYKLEIYGTENRYEDLVFSNTDTLIGRK